MEVPLTKQERRKRARRLSMMMAAKRIDINKLAKALRVEHRQVRVLLRGEQPNPRDYSHAIEIVESL